MRDLNATWDGDQPIYRVRFRDGAGYRDFSAAACVFYIEDQDGNSLGARPAIPISPKSSGYADFFMKGRETDWDGLGKELYVIPVCYYAQAADRSPAVNLLTNPSFDTYTGGTGIADGWTMSGTQGAMVFDVGEDDPAPPTIFGKRQRVYVPSAGSTAFLTQAPAASIAAGDYVSCGFWTRAKLDTGASLIGEPGYYWNLGAAGSTTVKTYHVAGDRDWTFLRSELLAVASGASASLSLISYDALGYEIRYDDAFLFKGRWAEFVGEVFRLEVQPRKRPSKTNLTTENFIGGIGGFDVDTNADGVADGWSKTGSTNTYAIERDPDHLNISGDPKSSGAEKITLNAATTDRLRFIIRGKFLAGQTWRFQVSYKNSGALTGSPANGDFGIVLHTEPFDGVYEESSLTGANFNLTSAASYLTKFRTLALTADHSVLVCDINLKTASGGTLWLDSARLWRSA